MTNLPQEYAFLKNEPGPKMILEALKEFGTLEVRGSKNNQKIIKWAAEVGAETARIYLSDDIPWCGLFMAVVAKRAGKEIVRDPLWALNWGNFGTHVTEPMLGDVLIFTRTTSDGKKAGHVGLYVGEDEDDYHVLGGNQSDCVCITKKLKQRLYVARRPDYHQMPGNVKKILIRSNSLADAIEA